MQSVWFVGLGFSAKMVNVLHKATHAQAFVFQTINADPAGKTTHAKRGHANWPAPPIAREGAWWTCNATDVGKITHAKTVHVHNKRGRPVRTFVHPIHNANLAAKGTHANSSNANKEPHRNVPPNASWISNATDVVKATHAKAELASHRRNLPPVRPFAPTTLNAVPVVRALFVTIFSANRARPRSVRHNVLWTSNATLVGRVSLANKIFANKAEARPAPAFV